MDWQGLRRYLQSLRTHPQELARLDRALAMAEEGLQVLSSMGHTYHLEPGPGKPLAEWPRRMYHITAAPNGRWVGSEYELWDLGPGWCDTLSEAQHRDGYAQQMAGRGGVNRRALPTLVNGEALHDDSDDLVARITGDLLHRHDASTASTTQENSSARHQEQ